MGKPDIEFWIASTSSDVVDNEDADYDETYGSTSNWEEARDDWPVFTSQAQRQLLSSSTKLRSSFIVEHLEPLCKNTGELAPTRTLV